MGTYILSIIIPAHNAGKTLARTLESISSLLSTKVQLILVDDGSTDETSDTIKTFVTQYPKVISIRQNHSGVSVARNTGMKFARGKYIWFIDADDTINSKAANDLLEKVKGRDYDFIWFSTVYKSLDNHTEGIGAIPSSTTEGVYTIRQWRKFYSGAGMLWQYWLKKGIIENEKIRFLEWASWFEDAHFLLHFTAYAKTIYIAPADVLYYYCVTPWSNIRSSFLKDRYTCNVRVYIDLMKRVAGFQKSIKSFCNGWAAINIAWCLRDAADDYVYDLYNECKEAHVFPLSTSQGTIKQKIQIVILNIGFPAYRKFCKLLRALGR